MRLNKGSKPSSYTERMEAENFTIKALQRQAFPEEIETLVIKSGLKKTSSLYKLNPFIDKCGTLRVEGRLTKGNVPEETKHPIIITKDSEVIRLLITHFHENFKHQGQVITLNEVRSNGFWIINGSKAVQYMIHKCVISRKIRCPVEEQIMSNLHEDSQVRCDQGSNFIGARNELKTALKECDVERIETFLAEKQCECLFNTPSSSHDGGIWERQIKTVRSILNATLVMSSRRLDDIFLRTFFFEAMAIVNVRPLSADSISDPFAPPPLTPNHLITIKSSIILPPPGNFVKEDLYLRKRRRRVQYLTEVFWGSWRKEYLKSLNERKRWKKPQRNMKVGDVVLVKDDTVHRMESPLAIVTKTITDDDGLVRNVTV